MTDRAANPARARAARALLPRLAIAATVLTCSAPALAGVYSVDDNDTAQGLEVKAKVYSERSGDQQKWRLPGLGVSGRLTDNLEWGVSGGYGMIEADGQTTAHGWRDLSAAIKWRFLAPASDDGISMGIEPELSLPTGDAGAGVGKGATSFELPLRISGLFGRIRVTGQISAERVFGRDDDSASAGVLTEYKASERWSLGFELVADAPCRHLRDYTLRADAGFSWKPNHHFKLGVLGGHSLAMSSGAPETVFRMELKYRP